MTQFFSTRFQPLSRFNAGITPLYLASYDSPVFSGYSPFHIAWNHRTFTTEPLKSRNDGWIMEDNSQRLKDLAKDLRREDPRPPDAELGGIPGLARTLDKCRASLLHIAGEFEFGCPFDRRVLAGAGIDQNEFRDKVMSGASDDEMAGWVRGKAEAHLK